VKLASKSCALNKPVPQGWPASSVLLASQSKSLNILELYAQFNLVFFLG